MKTMRTSLLAGQAGALARRRFLIGLFQALALTGLGAVYHYKLWPGSSSVLFSALLMASLFLPVLWLSGVGLLDWRQLRRWSCGALALILVFAVIDAAGGAGTVTPEEEIAFFVQTRFGELLLGAGFTLYIGHVMVLAGAREQRWIAARATYLSCAWRLGVQLMLSLLVLALLCIPVRFVIDTWTGACEAWLAIWIWTLGLAGTMHLTAGVQSAKRERGPA